MKKLSLFLTLSTSFFLLLACSNDEPQAENEVDTAIVTDAVQIESTTDILYAMGEYYLNEAATEGGHESGDDCATVTYQPIQNKITIDFGTEGCTWHYGGTHKGKVIITYQGTRGETPIPFTITTENYSWNDFPVNASLTSSGFVANDEGGYDCSQSSEVTITFPDATTYSLNTDYDIEWQEGFNDDNPLNNVVVVTGSSEGVNRRGNDFSSLITSPLVRKTTCGDQLDFITVSGVKTVSPIRLGGYSINYGNGDCDRSVTITTQNRTFDITLPNPN